MQRPIISVMLFWTLIIFIILFSVLFVLYPVTKSIAQASFCGNFIGKIFLPMLTVRPMQDDQCRKMRRLRPVHFRHSHFLEYHFCSSAAMVNCHPSSFHSTTFCPCFDARPYSDAAVARSADAILPPLVFTPMMLFLSLARA